MGKTLILYATAGIGHKKAALAIKEAFDKRGLTDVLLKDVLNYTSKLFKISYNSIYLFLVKYIPTLWGIFYYLLDNPFLYHTLISPIRRMANHTNSKKFVEFLLKLKPKTVIVTHFFPLEVIAYLKKKGILDTYLIAIVTDYKSHIFWLSKYVNSYIAASDYTKNDLIRRRIEAKNIKVFGIPCAKKFSEERNLQKLKSRIGLKYDKKTIFILGGGFGVGPIKEIVVYLDKVEADFQVIVVCGYNKKLHKTIKKIAQFSKHTFKIYGFVDNIDELMAVSDVLISKPGGITVTEALNAALPMIVMSPIPGQEMRNYKFLEIHNAALKITNPKEIGGVVEELFKSNKLDILRENIKRIRYIDSAERIVDEITK